MSFQFLLNGKNMRFRVFHLYKNSLKYPILSKSREREREREKEMAAEQTGKTSEAYPMKGGDDVRSYVNNSSFQVIFLYIQLRN